MAAARWRERTGIASATLAPSMVGWALLSMLPDSDVIGFSFGVPYESILGHRGITHSFAFALVVAMAAAVIARGSGASARRTAVLTALVVFSHGLLDTLTDGGRGVALLWPLSEHRFFAPWHPIPVSPIGLGILTRFGVNVAARELVLFAPVFAYALWPRRQVRHARVVTP
jgi:inner membrane protein